MDIIKNIGFSSFYYSYYNGKLTINYYGYNDFGRIKIYHGIYNWSNIKLGYCYQDKQKGFWLKK